jgi:hypothetical protein
MDRAFGGNEHSLLDNIRPVRDELWEALPQGAKRSTREITRHVGLFKYIYANHAFDGADMDYSDPAPERHATLAAAAQWLGEAHAYLIGFIRELSDADLDVLRKAHWGQLVPTHDLIVTMLEHDLYHAGEINRTRALVQNDDNWWNPDSQGST